MNKGTSNTYTDQIGSMQMIRCCKSDGKTDAQLTEGLCRELGLCSTGFFFFLTGQSGASTIRSCYPPIVTLGKPRFFSLLIVFNSGGCSAMIQGLKKCIIVGSALTLQVPPTSAPPDSSLVALWGSLFGAAMIVKTSSTALVKMKCGFREKSENKLVEVGTRKVQRFQENMIMYVYTELLTAKTKSL